MSNQLASRFEIEDVIQKQAQKNSAYRQKLIADPKDLIERQLGEKLPEDLSVEVVQETPNKIYIRLPHVVSEGDVLQDEDLQRVAGGKGGGDNVYCNNPAAAGGFASKNEISLL